MRTNITKTSIDLIQSPPKILRPLGRICKREKYLGIYDVDFFWGGGLWMSSIEVLVILVRIRIYRSPISSCLNYYIKNYGQDTANNSIIAKFQLLKVPILAKLKSPTLYQ